MAYEEVTESNATLFERSIALQQAKGYVVRLLRNSSADIDKDIDPIGKLYVERLKGYSEDVINLLIFADCADCHSLIKYFVRYILSSVLNEPNTCYARYLLSIHHNPDYIKIVEEHDDEWDCSCECKEFVRRRSVEGVLLRSEAKAEILAGYEKLSKPCPI